MSPATLSSSPTRARVAIIGGGYTGSVLAVNLLREELHGVSLTLIERAPAVGRGLAYRTQNPQHLLNVRAANMSAFADDPTHFLRWLKARGGGEAGDASGAVFVPRQDYGLYIEDVFRAAVASRAGDAGVTVLHKSAVSLRPGAPATITFDDGTSQDFDHVVLCIGNFPPAAPAEIPPEVVDCPRFIADPWDDARLAAIPPADPVLIVGSGLTMADVVDSLRRHGHSGPIETISRHGLEPQRHLPVPAYPPFLTADALPASLLALLMRVRREVKAAAAKGVDWRSVIDSLRPLTTAIWLNLPDAERRRFLRHLRPYWDVHRHRLAPTNADTLAALRKDGRLRMHAGRIVQSRLEGDGIVTVLRRHRSSDTTAISSRWMINCSGPLRDFTRIEDRLVRGLFEQGHIRSDALRLGLDITPDNRLLNRDGRPWDNLYALGPPTLGAYWEIIAVPDLRNACAAFAKILARRLRTPR